MKFSRRLMLQALAATAAGTAVSRSFATPTPLTTWAPASGWGTFGAPRRVLEIFLRGGASQWGAFWYDATLGAATGDTTLSTVTDWPTITNGIVPPSNFWQGYQLGRAAAPALRYVSNGLGVNRFLGQHMRVIRVRHELLPHEAAIPYTATGTTLGRTHMSGLGAAIWRRADEQEGPLGVRSLVFQSGSESGDDLAARYAAMCGNHGPEFIPPIITLGDPAFYNALPRTNLTTSDALKGFYRDRYEDRLRFTPAGGGAPFVVRSDGFSAYNASLNTALNHHQALHSLLAPYAADLFPDPLTFVPDYHTQSLPRHAVEAAISLLSTTDVRHVAVIDGGVESHYDTHKGAAARTPAFIQNGNIWSTLDALADNLNTILDNGIAVLLHSEFGRIEETANDGTEHHMKGYVNAVISDLITSPGFTGDIDPVIPSRATFAGGALDGLSPTDTHAAVAQLAGIEPWQTDMFDDDQDLASLPGADEAYELLGVL